MGRLIASETIHTQYHTSYELFFVSFFVPESITKTNSEVYSDKQRQLDIERKITFAETV